MDLGGFDRFANLKALWNMEHSTDLSSATDMYCKVGIPTRSQPIMDPTQPPLPEKARTNFIDGYAFLQADTMTDFTNFDTHLSVSSHLAARRCNYTTTTLLAESDTPFLNFDEPGIATTILTHLSSSRQNRFLNRTDFFAFDPLAEPPTATLASASGSGMTASSFDRTFRIISEDLAPYVRSVAAFDMRLENERMLVSNMLSAGGKPKRQRTTRAARSALEGGRRETTRRERWFGRSLNLAAVMRTAGPGWAGMGAVVRDGTETGSARSVGGSDVEMVE
ncbi:ATPAse AAA+ type core protein [Neofusicoccum parvum]|uniref:ATPAse AAA+ type core protein n=1 Tax=Neofusicoccum parvum TaxID=310453 RepID=A0ACB5S1S3_9PEZI|nr:ATPAse AAA+ type core protein [Neofusicoccum parvum]